VTFTHEIELVLNLGKGPQEILPFAKTTLAAHKPQAKARKSFAASK
jgi:hypothetical protein